MSLICDCAVFHSNHCNNFATSNSTAQRRHQRRHARADRKRRRRSCCPANSNANYLLLWLAGATGRHRCDKKEPSKFDQSTCRKRERERDRGRETHPTSLHVLILFCCSLLSPSSSYLFQSITQIFTWTPSRLKSASFSVQQTSFLCSL